MVTFTRIPDNYAPVGAQAVYAFRLTENGTVDVRITSAEDGRLLAAKRFAAVTEGSFDAAPCLRRAVRIAPAVGGTGVRPAEGQQLLVNVQLFAEDGTELLASAPTRIFLAGNDPVQAPALLTAMPRNRLLARGECDELLLLFERPGSVTVTAGGGASTEAQRYPVPTTGLYVFRLDVRDFPGAQTLTVDAGTCGTVDYALLPAPQGSVRLAWRSAAGGVEHYTFPVVRTERIKAAKRRAYGPEGYVAAAECERRWLLVSAYETQEVLHALAELLATPDVWIAEGDRYTPVEVLTDETVVRRHGVMCCMEVEIRPARKTRLPWN